MKHSNFGLPTCETKREEKIKLHLYHKIFTLENYTFQYKRIKQISFNLFAIEGDFSKFYDYCFRPKWYQCLKFYPYFYGSKIIEIIKLLK